MIRMLQTAAILVSLTWRAHSGEGTNSSEGGRFSTLGGFSTLLRLRSLYETKIKNGDEDGGRLKYAYEKIEGSKQSAQ